MKVAVQSTATRLHLLRGGGHLFLIFRADETANLVEEFLAEAEPH